MNTLHIYDVEDFNYLFVIIYLSLKVELEQIKMRLEKLEKERNDYKHACDRLETKVSVITIKSILKSGTGIQYPNLTIDPRRSFKWGQVP